jgi:hypothetical protein
MRSTDRHRREKFSVLQKSVCIPSECEDSQNYREEVQYRLSTLTPIELRRRRNQDNSNIVSSSFGNSIESINYGTENNTTSSGKWWN